MAEPNGLSDQIPDLGIPSKVQASVQLGAIARRLNHDGVMEMRVVRGPAGPQAVPTRHQLVDAEELVEMIREVFAHELRRYFLVLAQQQDEAKALDA